MKLTLSAVGAKIFGRSVQALAKIGEELVITSTGGDTLSLQAANTAKSAFGCLNFSREFFIECGGISPFTANVNTKGGILLAFRFTAGFERHLQWCELQFSKEALTIRFVCRADIVKVYHVRLIDGHNFVYNVDIKKYPNFIKGPARLLLDVVSQFPSKVVEVTLAVTSDKLTLRNFVDESEQDLAVPHSSVTFERREFESFDVPDEAMDITFSLKTFKTILNYSEAQCLDVSIHYDKPGAHVIVKLTSAEVGELSHLDSTFVLATLDEATPDVVQEDRAKPKSSVRRKELSIRNPATPAVGPGRMQKVTSQFEESIAIPSGEAKRPRRDNDSDEEFANLLETDENLHRIITQKEQEAARVQLVSQTPDTDKPNELELSVDQSLNLVTPCDRDDGDAALAASSSTPVSTMAKILMQNQAKARRGLLKARREDLEVLVPPSDDEDG